MVNVYVTVKPAKFKSFFDLHLLDIIKKMLLTSFLGLYCKLQNLVLPLGFKACAR